MLSLKNDRSVNKGQGDGSVVPSVGEGLCDKGTVLLSHNLFSYCENNPVMGYDPLGHWNLGGFLAGIAIAAIGIIAVVASVTTVVGAPLAIAAAKVAVAAVGVALTGTGVVTSYAAATERPMVLDVSTTNGSTHEKKGFSMVLDFDTDSVGIDTYYHTGSTNDGYGASYGFGLVTGYENPGDYGGWFVDGGVTYSHNGFNFGIDACTDPSFKCAALSGTVGISFSPSPSGKVSGYCGADYYIPLSYIEWG